MLKKFAFLFLAIAWADAAAQDLETTQLLSNPFMMCPAQVGNADNSRASLLYRNNWASSFIVGFDAPVDKLHGGLGIAVVDNCFNDYYSTKSLKGVYSYKSRISDDFCMRSAVLVGMSNYHKNDRIPEDTNMYISPGVQNKMYFDQGLSFAFDYKKLSFGISGFHLLKPDIGFTSEYRLDRSFSFFIGYDLWMLKGENHKGIGVTPLFYLTNEMGSFKGTIGFDFVWNGIFAGAYYRTASRNYYTLIYHAGARVGRFQFGYAYDKSNSNFLQISGVGHELFLNYFFSKK